MAKKSAKSKGYRKTVAPKPYLSKKDITWLCVIVAVLAVGAFLLFSYDDGALKTKDGVIVDAGENWLVINGSNNHGHRYYKVGEALDMEGYARESKPIASDVNLKQFIYTPVDGDGPIQTITMMASPYAPAAIAQYSSSLYGTMDGVQMSDIREGQSGEWSYTYYAYTRAWHADDDAESETTEDAAPNRFEQAITAYVPAVHDGCVAITVEIEVPSEADWLAEDELTDAVAQAMASLKLEV